VGYGLAGRCSLSDSKATCVLLLLLLLREINCCRSHNKQSIHSTDTMITNQTFSLSLSLSLSLAGSTNAAYLPLQQPSEKKIELVTVKNNS